MSDQRECIVTATEFKQNLGKYMARVEEFNDVVITKRGVKVARLTPYISDIQEYLAVREKALDYQYSGKKVSYAEFVEVSSKSELRMEFINGEIHILSSPSITHQEILGRLYLIFHDYLLESECRVFLAPFAVHFYKQDMEEPDVLQPDLLIICDLEGNISESGRYLGTPTLVVEILSASTRTKDMIDKLNTYLLSGVQEYWIVDPEQKTVFVYSFKDCEIASYKTYQEGASAESLVFEGLQAAISELFSD